MDMKMMKLYLISLSAYYDESLDTQEPTRYDIWVYNQTVRADVLQYISIKHHQHRIDIILYIKTQNMGLYT